MDNYTFIELMMQAERSIETNWFDSMKISLVKWLAPSYLEIRDTRYSKKLNKLITEELEAAFKQNEKEEGGFRHTKVQDPWVLEVKEDEETTNMRLVTNDYVLSKPANDYVSSEPAPKGRG